MCLPSPLGDSLPAPAPLLHLGHPDAAAEGAGGPDVPGWVPLEVARGGLVLLHGAVLHKSGRNTSGVPRHAYSMHVIDERPGVVWDESNWLQRPSELPFRAV